MAKTNIIFMLLLGGCAVQTDPLEKSSITIFRKQSQSVAIVIHPPAISRVPQDTQFQWSPPAYPDSEKVDSYNLYYGTESGCYSNKVHLANITNGVTPGLLGGITYYVAVTDQDVDGGESDFSNEAIYTPPLVMDLRFAFDQPVTNVVLQASTDLVRWQDLGTVPTNGTWRVTADPNVPMVIYRSAAQTTP
jgi:hypothetical protein